MCLHPLLIKNPAVRSRLPDNLYFLRDSISQYIYVPCGVCLQCTQLKQSYLIQRARMMSDDYHMFFGTLTYSDDTLPYLDVGDYRHYYADLKDFTLMIKRFRRYDRFDRDIKYLVVSEFGGKKHRPHIHFILFYPINQGDTYATVKNFENFCWISFLRDWRRNIGSTRNPNYVNLCNYTASRRGRNYDFHYVNPASGDLSDVAFYVTKYLLKFDSWVQRKQQALRLNLDPDEYKKVWSVIRPRVQMSKGFGITSKSESYVKSCIRKSLDSGYPYPLFINPSDGKTFPLSPYYRKKYMTLDDAVSFYYNQRVDRDYNMDINVQELDNIIPGIDEQLVKDSNNYNLFSVLNSINQDVMDYL